MAPTKRPLNTELLQHLADAIEGQPTLYDQRSVGLVEYRLGEEGKLVEYLPCETPCCVAGWTVRLTDRRANSLRLQHSSQAVLRAAAECLGLTDPEARALFAARWPVGWLPPEARPAGAADLFEPTAPQAAALLRRLARGERSLRTMES